MSKIKVTEIAPSSSNTPSITLGSNSNVTFANGVTATSFTGDGANLTNLDLTNLNAQNLTSGTIPDARFPATLPAVSGANLTGISAGALEHVADYTVPTGTQPSAWVIHPNFNNGAGGVNTGFAANTKYFDDHYFAGTIKVQPNFV